MMERLTKISEIGNAYYPKCFEEPCCGMGECLDDKCSLMLDACKKLAEYEQLEEQGLLVRLPCKVGDTVYKITRFCSGGIRDCGYSYECSECPEYKPFIEYIEFKITILKDIGKTVFLTREEAERKLEEMKNE
jgi:hypothetical protein